MNHTSNSSIFLKNAAPVIVRDHFKIKSRRDYSSARYMIDASVKNNTSKTNIGISTVVRTP